MCHVNLIFGAAAVRLKNGEASPWATQSPQAPKALLHPIAKFKTVIKFSPNCPSQASRVTTTQHLSLTRSVVYLVSVTYMFPDVLFGQSIRDKPKDS